MPKENKDTIGEKKLVHTCSARLCCSLVTEIPDAVFICNLEGRVVLANPAFTALFDITADEVLNRPIGELQSSEIRDMLVEQNSAVLASGLPKTFEFTSATPKGMRTFLVTKGVQRDSEQRVSGVFGVARNITERRMVEQEIIDTSDKEKQRLGREMRENFCQQLVGISLLGNALYEELQRAGLEQADFARQIAKLVKEVVSEVRALEKGLSVAHLEQGEGLVEALEDLAEQTRAGGDIECIFHAPLSRRSVEPQIAMYLFRIAQEAVHNACAHSEAHRVEIRLLLKQDAVVLSVRDDGVGFSQNELRSLGVGSRIGFPIMKHRSHAIGAKLEIKHLRRGGIEVICTVPTHKVPKRRR